MTCDAEGLLARVFGYGAFRGEQKTIIHHVANGGDALVLMPTGGGKSMCYQLPALMREGTAIVVSPLIALMHNQVSILKEAGVAAEYLNSSLEVEEARAVEQALRAGTLKLLYVAPERLLTPRFLELLDALYAAQGLALFAIDEAHCVSQWGHDFRPEYLQLSILPERYPRIPRIALTATADQQTRDEIVSRLHLGAARCFVSSFDRPNIHYSIVEKTEARRQLLSFLILSQLSRTSGIVYCLTRRRVEKTAEWLNQNGVVALPYHAGLSAQTRMAHQERFLREDSLVMVATIAFGMGIDKPDVRFVAHIDLPRSMESYYQETGRAGRDGLPAWAWMAWSAGDVVQHRRRIDLDEGDNVIDDEAHRQLAHQRLDALVGLAETTSCRRQQLLAHLGEETAPCGNCDNCMEPPKTWDATEAARKALSCIYRAGQRYGAGYLIDVLRGKRTEKVLERGHEQLTTFGIGENLDEKHWQMVFRQLVAQHFVNVDYERFHALVLSEAARPLLRGEARLFLRQLPEKQPRLKKQRKAAEATGERGVFDEASAPLFERLRAWRAATARERNVAAYIIFHDTTLRELASSRPQTLEELRLISGVGERKLEAYGKAILAVLAEAAQAEAEAAK